MVEMTTFQFAIDEDGDGGYHRLRESSNMSIDSQQANNDTSMYEGGSMYNTRSVQNGNSMASSVASNSSMTNFLSKYNGRSKTNSLVGHSVVHNNRVMGDDALVCALLDNQFPAEGLQDYDEWTINISLLSMGPAFAQGAFGRIYKGSYNGQDVAVKILERPQQDLVRSQVIEQQYCQEVCMLANLRHENVVRFIGACQKPGVWCIITEYVKGGSLRIMLSKKRAPPLRLALRHALDIARGMEYLHSFGVIHRDLKSDNLLMAEKSIKIADFGVARIAVQTEDMTPETGTYRWMAPEMMQNRSYNNKVDVYSFGIVLWELVTGKIPFQKMSAVQAASAAVKGARPDIPVECPSSLSKIMTRCWDANPDVRPTFSEVVKLLEDAQHSITETVGTARFRGCLCMMTPHTLN